MGHPPRDEDFRPAGGFDMVFDSNLGLTVCLKRRKPVGADSISARDPHKIKPLPQNVRIYCRDRPFASKWPVPTDFLKIPTRRQTPI